jgi:hypothetical protein
MLTADSQGENRDYHYLSQSEIGGGKRISRHLSGPTCPGPPAKASFRLRDLPGVVARNAAFMKPFLLHVQIGLFMILHELNCDTMCEVSWN